MPCKMCMGATLSCSEECLAYRSYCSGWILYFLGSCGGHYLLFLPQCNGACLEKASSNGKAAISFPPFVVVRMGLRNCYPVLWPLRDKEEWDRRLLGVWADLGSHDWHLSCLRGIVSRLLVEERAGTRAESRKEGRRKLILSK